MSEALFGTALLRFATGLQRNFASLVTAQAEDQLKPPVQDLIASCAPLVESRTEAQVLGLGARPDIGVTVNRLLCGYIELKAPGLGADANRLRGENKKQWEKFKALPNLLYTDSQEWALYRFGERQGSIVKLGDVIQDGASAITSSSKSELFRLVTNFLTWNPSAPGSPDALAQILAPLCRLVRQDVLIATKLPGSALRTLAAEWRSYLFPDADDEQFADAYAQTLTYALLLARFSGEDVLTTESAAHSLDSGHGLLAQALRILAQPAARLEIALGVDVLERVIRAVDPQQLRQKGDPWLYFYEDFLSRYDRKLRASYGVYYTPQEVISSQVNIVSQLLQTVFGKRHSFASDEVVFIDPAAGTSAYPLAAIEHALEVVELAYGPGVVPARATECARNFYAFEILVGPYAVGHLRLTKLLLDRGGSLPPDGIRLMLTDALESPYATPAQPPLFARQLTEEHRRAQTFKTSTRVMVCMGNPPYDRQSAEADAPPELQKGGWVRFGDPNVPDERPILDDFKQLATVGEAVHLKNLYNDYVYFWRWALWKLFENPQASGPGIISFITASSYLRGPGFAGMRRKMREEFDEAWIIDLEGDQNGARKTANVFAIKVPVAILIGVRYADASRARAGIIHYTKIEGTRAEKLLALGAVRTLDDFAWATCPDDWYVPFIPLGTTDFFSLPTLTQIMPWHHSGTQFKRNWPIAETEELARRRWLTLLSSQPERRGELLFETRDLKATDSVRSLSGNRDRLPKLHGLDSDSRLQPVRYGFRSFDRQWAILDPRVCDYPRPALVSSLSENQIFLSTSITNSLGMGPAATLSSDLPDMHHFCGRGGKDIFPLFRQAGSREANFTLGLLEQLSAVFGNEVTAEDTFAYIYSILCAPAYTSIFSEELGTSEPRIPFTQEPDLFNAAVAAGRRMICLHTFGARCSQVDTSRTPQGSARAQVPVPDNNDAYPTEFSYDVDAQVLRVGDGTFGPVSQEVWLFEVSGLIILESWLKYRMQAGYGRRSSPLDDLRPLRWTATMSEDLLELIWILEASQDLYPSLEQSLTTILAGRLLRAVELPQPTTEERDPPSEESSRGQLTF